MTAECKVEVECRADAFVPICFAIFPPHLSHVLRVPRQSEPRSYEVLHLSRKISENDLSKPEDLMLQSAALLRKSAP